VTLDPAIGWILALGLGLLLAAAATHKLADLPRFRAALAGYRLLPEALVTPATAIVIGLEMLATAMLVMPSWRAQGALLAAGLLMVYAFALGLNLLRGRTRIDCGCLGFGRAERISWWIVVRNLVLVGCALIAALPPASRALGALDLLTIGASVTSLAILYPAIPRLAVAPLRPGSAS
jgi:hypothetical protein